MKKTVFLLFCFCNCCSIASFAQSDWKYFLTSESGDRVFLSHAKKNKKLTKLWIKYDKPSADTVTGYERSLAIRTSVHYVEYDCENQRSRILSITNYYVDGSTLSHDSTLGWSYIIPGSIGEDILHYLCEGKRPYGEASLNTENPPSAAPTTAPPPPAPPPLSTSTAPQVAFISDGRKVLLNSDGTWSFDYSESNINVLKDAEGRFTISLPARWTELDKPLVEGAQFSFQAKDPLAYGEIVAENIPLTENDVMKYFWAQNDSNNTKRVRESEIYISGKKMHLAVIDVDRDGMLLRMYILVYCADSWYFKSVAWSFKTVALKNEDAITSFFEGIHVTE